MTRTRTRPARPRFALALLATAFGALLLAGTASAALPTPAGTVDCTGTPATSCSPGQVAVDESSGDVYMIDLAHEVIDRFDAQGNYLSQIAGLPVNEEDDLAVDNSGGPNQGRLYYGTYGNGELIAYGSGEAGNQQLWHTSEGLGSEPCGVAVDSAGRPWVGSYDVGVQQHSAADGSTVGGYVATDHTAFGPETCRIAFDSADNLYVNIWHAAIYKYAAADYTTSLPGTFGSPRYDVAVDISTGDVYAINGAENIPSWDSAGASLGEFGSSQVSVTVDGSHGRVYAGGSSAVQVWTTDDATAPEPYVRTAENGTGTAVPPTAIGSSTATVHGTVNPAGASTTCAVQYTDDASFQAEGFAGAASHACASAPGSGTSQVAAESALSGLSAGTTYHYRLLATNANGTTIGSASTLTTSAPRLNVYVTGSGSVGASSGTISGCTAAGGASCEGEYTSGTTVTLTGTPTPASGYVLAGWLGCKHASASTCEVTVNASTEVTAVFLKEGTQGTPGDQGPAGGTGPAGPVGSNGSNGAQGAKGDTGAAGPQGAVGSQGPVAKVTCKVKGAKKPKVTCRVKQSASASSVHWRLMRGGDTVRQGSAADGRLRLGALPSGRYRLHIAGRAGPTAIVVS